MGHDAGPSARLHVRVEGRDRIRLDLRHHPNVVLREGMVDHLSAAHFRRQDSEGELGRLEPGHRFGDVRNEFVGRDENVAFLVQGHENEPRVGNLIEVGDAGVQFKIAQSSSDFDRGEARLDLHPGQRVRSTERGNGQGDRRRGTGYYTQPQDAGHSGLDCLNFSLERVMLGQDTFGPNDQAFALRSQTLKGMTTIDQRNIELLLQPADRSGEGGLGNVTCGRGTSEMSFPGHGDKILELAKPHSRSFDLGDYCACTPR